MSEVIGFGRSLRFGRFAPRQVIGIVQRSRLARAQACPAAYALQTVAVVLYVDRHRTCARALPAAGAFAGVKPVSHQRYRVKHRVDRAQRTQVLAKWPVYE